MPQGPNGLWQRMFFEEIRLKGIADTQGNALKGGRENDYSPFGE